MFEIPDDDHFWEEFQEDDVCQSTPMISSIKSQRGDTNCNVSNSLTQNRLSENHLKSVNPDNRLCSLSNRTAISDIGHHHQGIKETHIVKESPCLSRSHMNNSRSDCSTASSNSYELNTTRAESTCASTPTIRAARIQNAYSGTPKVNVTARPETACDGASVSTDKSRISPPTENSTPRDRRRSKRKFPGPAGVLPKLSPGQSLNDSITVAVQTPARATHDDQDQTMASSSQSGDDMFNDDLWHRMLADIGPNANKILQKFSIADVLDKARRKQLPQMRASLVIGVIESIDSQGPDACVTLRDKSGSMKGTFHCQLMKDYEEEIHLGTVMVLRQVGVISPSSRNHYLNITSTNIVLLYNTQPIDRPTQQHANLQDYSKLRDVVKEAESQKQTVENNPAVTTRSGTASEIRCQGTPVAASSKHPRCENARQFSSPVINNKIRPCFSTIMPDNCNTPNRSAGFDAGTTPRRSIPTSESMMGSPAPSSSTKSKWNFKQKSYVTNSSAGNKDVEQFSCESQSQLTSTPAHIPPPPRLVMLGSTSDSCQQAKSIKNTSTVQNAAADLCVRAYQLKPTPACQPNCQKTSPFNVENLWQDDLSDDLLSQLSEEM